MFSLAVASAKVAKKKIMGNLKMTPTNYSSQSGADAKCEKVHDIVMVIFCCVEFSKCRIMGILRSQPGWHLWHKLLENPILNVVNCSLRKYRLEPSGKWNPKNAATKRLVKPNANNATSVTSESAGINFKQHRKCATPF